MSNALDHAYAVVLAGGSGTRLWPVSRDGQPKQFLKLGGDRTMMQSMVDRILPLIPAERIIVVTNKEYAGVVHEQLPDVPAENIIAEPEKRDTALAMALGSLVAQKRDPEAVVTNLASDHVIKDAEEYRRVLRAAIELAAQKQYLLTVGIRPTDANVNFGYIQADGEVSEIEGVRVYKVLQFKEKPDFATAQQFLQEGNYYWNANMYTWHVQTVYEAFAQHYPQILAGLDRLLESIGTSQQEQVLAEVYQQAEKISIDYAISEKASNLLLIPGDFGWDDIGLWSTVYDLGKKDENRQVVVRNQEDTAPVLAIDSHGNLINTNGRMVALLGVEDLVVVDSDDVILIAPRSRAAEVKNIVAELKEQNLQQYL